MRKFLLFVLLSILSSFYQIFAQECGIIYVTPNGTSDIGSGTRDNPTNINHALSLISPQDRTMWLASGNYNLSNTLNIIDNFTIEGGFDPNTWIKTNNTPTIIRRDSANIQNNPNRLVALSATNVNLFNIHDLTIITADAVGNGVTNYGIYLNNCSFYYISRVTVKAGNGSNGFDGQDGINGVNGANGVNGGDGCADCSSAASREGGEGGSGSYPGSHSGGKGGEGGIRCCASFFGTSNCSAFPTANGQPGLNGQGINGGAGGSGGAVVCSNVSLGCDGNGPASDGQPGQNGLNGINGADGANGVASFSGGFFQNATGQNGENGQNGGGGGGGGGGGSQSGLSNAFGNVTDDGPGGAGGGEGGQGGTGAQGGTGGGGSFALFVWNNGFGGQIKDGIFESGLPGQGGLGSQIGGIGGFGGLGGPGGNRVSCDIGFGGPGGNGGNGGMGGKGGNGNAGLSFPVYIDQNGIEPVLTNMNSPVEPSVFVENKGCSKSDVTLSTNANGFVQWFFNQGANPIVITGNQATIQLDNINRHSFTLVVNGLPYFFNDFIGIIQDGTPFIPEIITNDTIVCINTPVNFASSLSAELYEWDFGSTGVNPGTIIGAQDSSVTVTFNQLGDFWVKLRTTSFCCGRSAPDSIKITVIPPLNAEVFIGANQTSACVGEEITFTATVINGGQNPGIVWHINGQATSNTGPTFTSSSLSNGDVITAVVTPSYACPINPTYTSAPITVTINPLPQVTCSASQFTQGVPTSFTANATGGTAPYQFDWNFGDSNTGSGQNVSHIFPNAGNYITKVTVTDANGCSTTCEVSVFIETPPTLTPDFISVPTSGCGTVTVQFTDQSTINPVAWNWNFGDGSTSAIQNPVHTYNQSGIYPVTLEVSNGFYTETLVQPNLITVYPVPVANFRALNQTGCVPITIQFIDESEGAEEWLWEFGDGNTSTLQNPSHTYNAPGTYTVTLTVTNQFGCTDTETKVNFVTTSDNPIANFNFGNVTFGTGTTVGFVNTSQGAVSYEWFFGDGATSTQVNPTHTYSPENAEQIVVMLIATNEFGCKDTIVKDSTLAFNINIPNIITPNNDGVNDFFVISNEDLVGYSLQIFNRWGKKIYQSDNYNNDWGGTSQNGSEVAAGVYYFIIRGPNNTEWTGHVTVVY